MEPSEEAMRQAAVAALKAWKDLPPEQHNEDRPYLHGFNDGWDAAIIEREVDTHLPKPSGVKLRKGRIGNWTRRRKLRAKGGQVEPFGYADTRGKDRGQLRIMSVSKGARDGAPRLLPAPTPP